MAITTRFGTPVKITWRHDDYDEEGWVQIENLSGGDERSIHISDLRAPGGAVEIDAAARACSRCKGRRRVPGLPREVLTPAVLAIAQQAYDTRDWAALPILADALQDAGCEDDDILLHLRGEEGCSRCEGAGIIYDPEYSLAGRQKCPAGCDGGMVRPLHARGCWVVDLVLGKE